MTARKQYEPAIAQFRRVLAANPNNLEARLGLARNLYYSRQVDEAIREYQSLIRQVPGDAGIKLELAQLFLDRNRLSEPNCCTIRCSRRDAPSCPIRPMNRTRPTWARHSGLRRDPTRASAPRC
jgi:tetratricopeptide (TPR) repeat protein